MTWKKALLLRLHASPPPTIGDFSFILGDFSFILKEQEVGIRITNHKSYFESHLEFKETGKGEVRKDIKKMGVSHRQAFSKSTRARAPQEDTE